MFIFMALIDNEESNVRFVKIYEKYRNLVIKTVASYFNCQYDVEDATQTVFFRIAKNIDNLDVDNESALFCYIVAVTRSCCIDLLRKKSREPKTVSLSVCEGILDGEDVSDVIEDKLLYLELVNYILSLKDEYRSVLYMFFVCDMSVSSISIALNINSRTVRTRLKRGIEKVKASAKEIIDG